MPTKKNGYVSYEKTNAVLYVYALIYKVILRKRWMLNIRYYIF